MMEWPPPGHFTLRAAESCLSRGEPPPPGCIMDNHFHLLVRVPHRPEGFDVALELVVARLERALGGESAKRMHRNLEFWRTTKKDAAIEPWRQQPVARMVCQLGLCSIST